MVTDTAFFLNHYCHAHSDSYKKLDYQRMARMSRDGS